MVTEVLGENLPPKSDFVEDDLPLPSFREVFGFIVDPSVEATKAGKKRAESHEGRSLAKKLRMDDSSPYDSGRWTADEHRLFLEGVMLYGKEWKKMQPLIKTRTLVQIRTHAQKVFKKIGLKKIGASSTGAGAASSLKSKVPTAGVNPNAASQAAPASDDAVMYRSDDMEVTEEEFNLVVQHLKNLGELRGDDFIDEADDVGEGEHGEQTESSSLFQQLLLGSSHNQNIDSTSAESAEGASPESGAGVRSRSRDKVSADESSSQTGFEAPSDATDQTYNVGQFLADEELHNQQFLHYLMHGQGDGEFTS